MQDEYLATEPSRWGEGPLKTNIQQNKTMGFMSGPKSSWPCLLLVGGGEQLQEWLVNSHLQNSDCHLHLHNLVLSTRFDAGTLRRSSISSGWRCCLVAELGFEP